MDAIFIIMLIAVALVAIDMNDIKTDLGISHQSYHSLLDDIYMIIKQYTLQNVLKLKFC